MRSVAEGTITTVLAAAEVNWPILLCGIGSWGEVASLV
jgi:hypothetical protein